MSFFAKNFIVFVIAFMVFSFFPLTSFSQLTSPNPFCFPTCESNDGRFLVISEGDFETFTPGEMNIQITVPPDQVEFSFGIFDGDAPGADAEGNWDLGFPSEFSYSLVIDPDRDNQGPMIFETAAVDLPSNDWADFTFNTDPQAQDEEGNFVYTLKIKLLEDILAFNVFKVRSSGRLSLDEPFGLVANISSREDAAAIFPNSNIDDGVQPEDYAVTTYDGSICLFFEVPNEMDELTIWDADLDHGNQNGTDLDTDDPNSPNTIPDFVPPGSDAINEGANPPNPFDDKSIIDDADFNNFLVRSPAVTYTVTFPDGRVFENTDPTGNREWEKFVISSVSDNPSLVDITTTEPIPAGIYELCLEGLDMQNLVAFRLPFPLIATQGDLPPASEVPTISEWGMIAMTVVLALLGVVAIRKRIYTQ